MRKSRFKAGGTGAGREGMAQRGSRSFWRSFSDSYGEGRAGKCKECSARSNKEIQ